MNSGSLTLPGPVGSEGGLFSFTSDELSPYELPRLRTPLLTAGKKTKYASPRQLSKSIAGSKGKDSEAAEGKPEESLKPTPPAHPPAAKAKKLGFVRKLLATEDEAPSRRSSATPDEATGEEDQKEVAVTLRTGEDAIAFFARYGSGGPIKFLHLNRMDSAAALS